MAGTSYSLATTIHSKHNIKIIMPPRKHRHRLDRTNTDPAVNIQIKHNTAHPRHLRLNEERLPETEQTRKTAVG